MTARLAVCFGSFLLALLTSVTMAQAPKAGVLSAEDLKRVVRSEARCPDSLLLSRAISLSPASQFCGIQQFRWQAGVSGACGYIRLCR